jgi:hypothetical protein
VAQKGAALAVIRKMNNQPDPAVIARLQLEEALGPTLRALYARREQLDILIALIQAERALSGHALSE